jgi:Mg-chelatase subunit ChlD
MNAASEASPVIQTLSDDQMKAIDFIALFDHSGSMSRDSKRMKGKTRWEELQEDAESLCRQAAKFDDDGITVIAFSNAVRVFDGVKIDAVEKLFQEVTPNGSTNLTDAVKAAIEKASTSAKHCVILAFTDGVPDDPSGVFAAINEAGGKLGRPKIGFTFVQVGEEDSAKKFLDSINNNLTVDVVGVVPTGTVGLSLGQLCWIAQNQ